MEIAIITGVELNTKIDWKICQWKMLSFPLFPCQVAPSGLLSAWLKCSKGFPFEIQSTYQRLINLWLYPIFLSTPSHTGLWSIGMWKLSKLVQSYHLWHFKNIWYYWDCTVHVLRDLQLNFWEIYCNYNKWFNFFTRKMFFFK